MAVQTSSVTTATNGNLTLVPDGTGQVVVNSLSGLGEALVGVDNSGVTKQFLTSKLGTGTPAGTDVLMVEVGGNQTKVTLANVLSAANGITLTDLSVTVATAAAQSSLVYDDTTGVFTFTPNTSLLGATDAEQAAGTLTTVYSSPATSVAKDAAGTTGALLSPVGTVAERPGTAVTGMLRYNSDTPTWEYYDGAAWTDLVPAGSVLLPATQVEQAAGTLTTVYSSPATSVAKDDATITGALLSPGGTTAERPGAAVTGMQRYNTDRGNIEWYDSADWQSLKNEDTPSVQSGAYTATADEYVVVDTATQTITLPASPEAGDNLLIVISGTFLDTIVARNGTNIMGLAEDMTIDIAYAAMRFTYTGDATEGWRVN